MKRFITTLLFIIFSINAAYTTEEVGDKSKEKEKSKSTYSKILEDIKKNKWSDFFYRPSLGYRQLFWSPGYIRNKGLKFDTEGIQVIEFRNNIGHKKNTFLFFQIDRPVKKTSSQDELYQKGKKGNGGVEKITVKLSLKSIENVFNVKNKFLKFLLSFEFEKSKESFFGQATATQDLFFVARNSRVTNVSNGSATFLDVTRINTGESVTFKTDFDNTTAIFGIDFKILKKIPIKFNFGYYDTEWERPSSNADVWTNTSTGLKNFLGTTFKSKGILFSLKNSNERKPGFNGKIVIRYGLKNRINNAVRENVKIKGKEPFFGWGTLDLWYNWFKDEEHKKGLFGTLGASLDQRYFAYANDPFFGAIEREVIYSIYGRVGYEF